MVNELCEYQNARHNDKNYPCTKFDQNLYKKFGNDTFMQRRPLLYVFINYDVRKAHIKHYHSS